MNRILITGDRNWTNRKLIEQFIDALRPDLIIEGGARGADTMAREICEARNIDFLDMPADWDQFPRSAGPIRNREMLVEAKRLGVNLVVAFHNDIVHSKGTADMVTISRKAGIPIMIVSEGLTGTAAVSFVSGKVEGKLI